VSSRAICRPKSVTNNVVLTRQSREDNGRKMVREINTAGSVKKQPTAAWNDPQGARKETVREEVERAESMEGLRQI